MPMKPIRVVYPSTSTGGLAPLSVDWRDSPAGFTYEVQFDGSTGSVTVETTLDDVNDASAGEPVVCTS